MSPEELREIEQRLALLTRTDPFDQTAFLAAQTTLITRDVPALLGYVEELMDRPQPPGAGWHRFGTHVECQVPLEFAGADLSEDGLPVWERVLMPREGYCTCDDGTSYARDCGIAAHREKASR